MYIKDLPDWLPENKYSSTHVHLLVQKTSMHKYTSRVYRNILVKYTEICKTFPTWYTSQGVNKTFPYRSRTTRVVRWYGMKSTRDVRDHYAPRIT